MFWGASYFGDLFLRMKMSHPALNCNHFTQMQIFLQKNVHHFQYSLTKSLGFKTKFSLIKVLECTRGRQRKVICKVLKCGFYSKVLFLLLLRLKFLVRERINHPQILVDIYPQSEKFKVLKVK